MEYRIKNKLIPVPESHRAPILATLEMYDKGEDITNSPLVQSKVNLTHMDVYKAMQQGVSEGDALLQRQEALISLYESIKAHGYNGSSVWCWFDDDGQIHIYDGYHRLPILEHLGLDIELTVETDWTGGVNGQHKGRDFPLADVLKREHPVGEWLYQPVLDPRVSSWKLARNDSPQRLEYILHNLVGETVLDIGCSEGYFSREIAKKGYKVTAIDTQHGYIASARYLSILEGVEVSFCQVDDWSDFLKDNGHYDNILLLSVIHNDMKKIGVEAGLEKLKAFRGKSRHLFMEVPQRTGERQWNKPGYPNFVFEENLYKVGSESLIMNCTGIWYSKPGGRAILTFQDAPVGPDMNAPLGEQIGALGPPGNAVGLVSAEDAFITQESVLVETKHGFKMHLPKDEPIITPNIRHYKEWEPELTEWFKKNLKPGQAFIDIGANVGYYTLLAAKLGCKVTAYEPAFDSFIALETNVKENNCEDVELHMEAVSATEGEAKLYNYGSAADWGRRGLTEIKDRDEEWKKRNPHMLTQEAQYVAVKTVNLNKFFTGTVLSTEVIVPPNFIKVDVEGGERDCLEGIKEILKLGKTTLILEDESDDNIKWVEETCGIYHTETIQEKINRLRHYIYRPEENWWTLEKWLPDYRNQYWPLFNTLRTKPCRNIMEIGTHNGKNAVVMIKTAAEKVPEEEIHYYGFDLFEEKTKEVQEQEFTPVPDVKIVDVQAFITRYTKAKVSLFKGNTRKILRDVVKTLPTMDLIYIDGGHSIETTRNDWRCSSKLVDKDTIVYFDDYDDEMPFIGSHFIVGELDPKYVAEVLPQTNYYKRPFGRLKCQLLRVTMKKPKPTLKTEHFRLHLIGLPHSKTIRDWGPCAFTQLTYRFSQMMHDIGHEVYHYGTVGSNPDCTEQIDVLTEDIQKQAYGDWSQWKQLWIHSGKDLAYTTFRKNAIVELQRRKEPGDILLISNGHWLKEISDVAGGGMVVVEPYVGYLGFYAKYKVFPSYAWMHHMYGKVSANKSMKENFATGNWYDAVIQHFFDPADYVFEEKKDDYILYSGRLIQRKGIHVAVDLCKRIGAKLVVAGQPIYPEGSDKYEWALNSVGVLQPHVEYVGTLNQTELDKWRRKARAVIVPSIYMEPFGLVVVEALMCGTPVITTDWGAFPEIVPQGEVGYRCRTMDDFVWAANNVHKISPKDCREYAVRNFSMERIGKAYHEYFVKVHDLFRGGWYEPHPERTELDWLKRY